MKYKTKLKVTRVIGLIESILGVAILLAATFIQYGPAFWFGCFFIILGPLFILHPESALYVLGVSK